MQLAYKTSAADFVLERKQNASIEYILWRKYIKTLRNSRHKMNSKGLHVSIPTNFLTVPCSVALDTPPTTPTPTPPPRVPGESMRSPKTPRKSLVPRRSLYRNSLTGATVVRFEFSRLYSEQTPTLRITAATPKRVRRKLIMDSALPESTWDVEPPIKKQRLAVKEASASTLSGLQFSLSNESDQDPRWPGNSIPLCAVDVYSTPVRDWQAKPSKRKLPIAATGSPKKVPKNDTKGKTCFSCNTKKTPLWRDAEDGTPYCNACGIRYKKYRIRCPRCNFIPHKDECSRNICSACGSQLVPCKFRSR